MADVKPYDIMYDISYIMSYGLTSAMTYYINICAQYCKTHIYPYTIFGYNNIGKTFSSDQKKPWQRSGKSLSFD